MKISITYISADRFFGKVFREYYQFIQDLQNLLRNQTELSELSEHIQVWFVDQPNQYAEVILSSKKLIEIHVGRDIEFDYRPVSGNDRGSKIKQEILTQSEKALNLILKQQDSREWVTKTIQDWCTS